jgi:hypothetical protein
MIMFSENHNAFTSSNHELEKVTFTSDMIRPTPLDVLCGRGRNNFRHNDHFRVLIAEYAETYKQAPTKKAKMRVVMMAVEIVIARGGRFLVLSNDDSWVDGGRKVGKKKVGHAFRDALRGRVKCITEMRAKNIPQVASPFPDYFSESSSSSVDSDGEFDTDMGLLDSRLWDVCRKMEPTQDWRNSKLDRDLANELLELFVAEQLGEQRGLASHAGIKYDA